MPLHRLLPRYYKCPGSPYDTETADGCTGAYLVHWDTDTTGQKVALVFVWLLLGLLFLYLLYALYTYGRARYRFRHVPRGERPRHFAWRETRLVPGGAATWNRCCARRAKRQDPEAARIGASMAEASRPVYPPDPPSNAPAPPPLLPPPPPPLPAYTRPAKAPQGQEKQDGSADATIQEVGRAPWLGKLGRRKGDDVVR